MYIYIDINIYRINPRKKKGMTESSESNWDVYCKYVSIYIHRYIYMYIYIDAYINLYISMYVCIWLYLDAEVLVLPTVLLPQDCFYWLPIFVVIQLPTTRVPVSSVVLVWPVPRGVYVIPRAVSLRVFV